MNLADWRQVCEEIRAIHPDFGVGLHLHDSRVPKKAAMVQDGFDPDAFPAYLTHYINHNPWIAGWERRRVGSIVRTTDIAPEHEVLASDFWKDWLRPQGDYAAGGAIVLSRALHRHCVFLVHHSHRSESARQRCDTLLREVGPHIERAFSLWRRSALERERAGMYEGCLGTLPMPLMIVDGARKLCLANEGAEGILRRLDGLVLGSNREVRAHDRTADDQLARAVTDVITSCRRRVPLVMVPKSTADAAAGHYVVSAFPAPRQPDDLGFGSFSFDDGALAMLAIHDTAATLALDPYTLTTTFGLTGTEAELACAMLEGATLADYAKRRAVSRYTVRNQLCSVMHKMGTHRQSDLVSLLTRIAITA